MVFKGTRRKWLKEGGIESRAYRSEANVHSKKRRDSQSRDGSGQQEAETARKLRL